MKFLGILSNNNQQCEKLASKALQLIHDQSEEYSEVIKFNHDCLYIILNKDISKHFYKNFNEQKFIILGQVYKNLESNKVEEDIPNRNINSIEEIASEYWGNYIAIQARNDKVEIFKAPIGHLSCYYTICRKNNCIIFTNKLFYIFKLLGLRAVFNEHYLLDFLVGTLGSAHLSTSTAFQDVYSIPPGVCVSLTLNGTISSKLVWNISKLTKNANNNLIVDNLEGIPARIQFVTRKLTQEKKNIFLDFSGGLDSTALIYSARKCLNSGQTLKAINVSHPNVNSSNELTHARKIANELGIELIEYDASSAMPFSPPLNNNFFPNKPDASLVKIRMEMNLISQFANSNNAVFIGGEGGDHLFMCPPAIESLCDIFLDKSISGFLQKSKEIGSLHRIHFLHILKVFLKNMYCYFNRQYTQGLDKLCEGWFNEKILIHALNHKPLLHPFYENYSEFNLQPGKFFQIDSLFHALASISGSIRGMHVMYPLLSQPIVELALSMPTYLMYNRSYDRYPFRKAISDYYNTDNVWRRAKGEVTGVLQLGIKENKDYVLEKCLEGYLSKNNFLDKDSLRQDIELSCLGQHCSQGIMHLFALEVFIDSWKNI